MLDYYVLPAVTLFPFWWQGQEDNMGCMERLPSPN